MNDHSLNHEASNQAAVRRLYEECLNCGNYQAANELISPRYISPGAGGGAGPEGFKANAEHLRAAFPDVKFTLQNLVARGDQVALYWTWEATHGGTFANIPPTGRRVQQEGMVMYRFADGKAVEAKVVFDRLGVLQQLGALPESPGVPKSAGLAKRD